MHHRLSFVLLMAAFNILPQTLVFPLLESWKTDKKSLLVRIFEVI